MLIEQRGVDIEVNVRLTAVADAAGDTEHLTALNDVADVNERPVMKAMLVHRLAPVLVLQNDPVVPAGATWDHLA